MKPFSIKILGSLCGRCQRLEHNVREALSELKMDVAVVKVEDIAQFMDYKITRIPALVVNEKVYAQGVVLSKKKILEIINLQLQSDGSEKNGMDS